MIRQGHNMTEGDGGRGGGGGLHYDSTRSQHD